MAMDCLPHIHMAAWHAEPGFRSATPGLGVLCDTDWQALRAGAGVFRNSEGAASAYGVGVFQPLRWGPLRVGVAGGGVTGYRRHEVLPLGGLAVSIRQSPDLEHHFLGIPRVRGVSPVTVQYSITFRF